MEKGNPDPPQSDPMATTADRYRARLAALQQSDAQHQRELQQLLEELRAHARTLERLTRD